MVVAVLLAMMGWQSHLNKIERTERIKAQEQLNREQQESLNRRGVWMAKTEQNQNMLLKFKEEIESRTADRWTRTDHYRREQEVFDALFSDNPTLERPEALSFPDE